MENRNWTLLVIAAARGELVSPIQLQKALFLVREHWTSVVKDEFYQFKPYNYGPFCRQIYDDAESLAQAGQIEIVTASGQSWSSYRVTQRGLEESERVRNAISKIEWEYLRQLATWIRGLSFEQLLAYIYSNYPEYTKNSVFAIQQ